MAGDWREGVLLATLGRSRLRQCGFLRLRACWALPSMAARLQLTAGRLKASSHCQGKSWLRFLLIISPVPLSHASHQPAKTNHETSITPLFASRRQVALPPAIRLPFVVSIRGPEGEAKREASGDVHGTEKPTSRGPPVSWPRAHRHFGCPLMRSVDDGTGRDGIQCSDLPPAHVLALHNPNTTELRSHQPGGSQSATLASWKQVEAHLQKPRHHIHAREVHSRGAFGWPPRKPFQARRCSSGPMAAFEGAALACSASAGRCVSQDWSCLEEDDLTLQLLRRWPSRTEDGCPRPGSRLDEARGSGRCRWRMRTTPASQTGLCSVLMASSVKNSRFSEEHRTTESHDGPGRAPGLARGTATPRPLDGRNTVACTVRSWTLCLADGRSPSKVVQQGWQF